MKKQRAERKVGESIYADIYALGDGYRRVFAAFFRGVARILKKFFRMIGLCFIAVFTFFGRVIKKYAKAIASECKRFVSEVKGACPNLLAAFRDKPSKGIHRFFHYVKKSFSSHSRFNRAAASTVLPILALLVLFSFGGTFKGLTFALTVTVDGQDVGTVANENAYKAAEKEAQKRFQSVGSDIDITLPEYRVTLTTVNRLDDTQTVCNRIIAAVSENTVNACGIYVGGEFLCAVNSEDTFTRVSNRVLSEYAETNGLTDDDCKVEFADNVTTVVGLYPDNEMLWTPDELYDYMSGDKIKAVEHVMQEGETIADLLIKYNLSQAELKKLNPKLDIENIPVGSTLLMKKGEKNLSVKVMKTYIKVETTPFDTVSQYDNNLYIGDTMTIVSGVPGRDVVSYTDTYIDGVLVDSARELVRYNANDPVNALIKIGTKGIPVDNNSVPVSPRLTRDQGGTFIWPAPDNCFWLSQGYNPSNSHYGIDICSSDSGSSRGRRIVAVADGVVVMATYHYSWGYYIRVDHGSGVVTGYAHALEGSFRVNVGDYVKAGQQLSAIGTTGNSTGYHLHFEVWLDGVRVNPLPYVYSQYTGAAVK